MSTDSVYMKKPVNFRINFKCWIFQDPGMDWFQSSSWKDFKTRLSQKVLYVIYTVMSTFNSVS